MGNLNLSTIESYLNLIRWFASDNVGESSKYLASVTTGIYPYQYAHPLDIGDLSRCIELIKSVPELEGRLHLMKSKSERWRKIVTHWVGLEELYIANDHKQLNKLFSFISE